MFWRFNYSNSQLQTLLDKEDVSLKEIMDEEDVLQECKTNNEKLVNFLVRPEVLNELVDNTIYLPSENLNEKERFKYATISCELLTCDISQINDALAENESIMDKLYSFLIDNNQKTINPLMASYFAKVFGCLISRKTESFLNFIQKKEDFLDNFVKNINTSAITDILLRLLTTIDSNELRFKVVMWLKNIKLVQGLINLFKFENSDDIHSNTSQIICDLIRISRDQILTQREYANELLASSLNNEFKNPELSSVEYLYRNSLLEDIESEENLENLFNLILESVDRPNSCLVHGVEVFLTILEPILLNENESNENVEEEKLRKEKEKLEIASNGIKSCKTVLLKNLSKLHDLLHKLKPLNEYTKLSNGLKIPILGKNRLQIIKLISKLTSLNDESINLELIKLKTLNSIFDMMFVYKWNNFLHSQIKEIITNCLLIDFRKISQLSQNEMKVDNESSFSLEQIDSNQSYLVHFFKDCNLILKMIHLWSEYLSGVDEINEKKIVRSKQNTVGYVGHLNFINNYLYKTSKESKYSVYVQQCLNKYVENDLVETWNDLNENKISKLNELNLKDLVRNPFLINSSVSNSDTTDFIDLPSDERMNKKYSDLQKEMKINCIEDFSISECQIVNTNSKSTGNTSKSKNISFAIESNDDSAQIFEQVCSQRDNMNLSTSASNTGILDEEVWVTKEIKFSDNNSTFEIGKDNWAVFSPEKEFKLKIENKNTFDELPSCTKKYSTDNSKLAQTNYSSSSSSSESSSDNESDDDNKTETVINIEKHKIRNKRHHQNHHESSNKESKYQETQQDEDLFSNTSANNQDQNWANFDQLMETQENQTDLNSQDPWETNEAKEPKEENWANFDNF